MLKRLGVLDLCIGWRTVKPSCCGLLMPLLMGVLLPFSNSVTIAVKAGESYCTGLHPTSSLNCMDWFRQHRQRHAHQQPEVPPGAPPEWAPAVEQSYTYGLQNEASDESYEKALEFCEKHPVESSAILPSRTIADIDSNGCSEWRIQAHDSSHVAVVHNSNGKGGLSQIRSKVGCPDTCILSNLPIVAGQYHFPNDGGVYFEITVNKMTDPSKGGVIAIGKDIFAPSVSPHLLSVRNCLQTIPIVEAPRLESAERRPSPRRLPQIL